MSHLHPPLWKQLLLHNFVDIKKLADYLELNETQRATLLMGSRFSLNLPLRLARKITKGDLTDPILRQFLPTLTETIQQPSFIPDPVGDSACRKGQKLLQKYQGRVLLVCTSACAMHCRYCFRQNFEYSTKDKSFDEELKLIAEDPSINEVILSGGDPLSLSNQMLQSLLERLALIPHIRKIRFHTRFPIGIPERIDEGFLEILKAIPLQFWFVIHSNHPRELDSDVLAALKSIQKLGIPVLNQFVLLRGVNDDIHVLYDLCHLLVNHGVMPYYLHQLDRVKGAAHFEVSVNEGKELIQALEKRLPGYAVPKYVAEIPGMPAKTPLM
jgi:EF-P beta-lysylation protein EpmB